MGSTETWIEQHKAKLIVFHFRHGGLQLNWFTGSEVVTGSRLYSVQPLSILGHSMDLHTSVALKKSIQVFRESRNHKKTLDWFTTNTWINVRKHEWGRCFRRGHTGSFDGLMGVVLLWIICIDLYSHQIYNWTQLQDSTLNQSKHQMKGYLCEERHSFLQISSRESTTKKQLWLKTLPRLCWFLTLLTAWL